MQGREYRLFVSTAGTAATPVAQVEMQGDLTINPGRTLERTGFKNGAVTAQGDNGWSATFQMALQEPIPAGQLPIWDAHDNATPLYIEVRPASGTGRMRWTGTVLVAITEIPNPVNGVRVATVELSQSGLPMVRGLTV